jgi:hypothetical protein
VQGADDHEGNEDGARGRQARRGLRIEDADGEEAQAQPGACSRMDAIARCNGLPARRNGRTEERNARANPRNGRRNWHRRARIGAMGSPMSAMG